MHHVDIDLLRGVFSRLKRNSHPYRIDLKENGRQVCASWLDGAERMIRAADACNSILHLRYREIIAAPQKAAERVFRHAGLTLNDEAAQRMSK